jgi:Protein of unknown function (DUF2927)
MKTCGPSLAAIRSGMRGMATIVQRRGLRRCRPFPDFASTHAIRWGIASLFALIGIVIVGGSAVWAESDVRTENEDVRIRRNSERTTFSDAEIADGFFKIAFGAELSVAGGANQVRKFDGPVRVFLNNRARANRHADIVAVVSDIRTYVGHLDIELTEDRKAANVVVTLVRDRGELLRTMRSFYGRKRADEIERRLSPRCLSGFSEDAEHRIRRAEVLLTTDGGDFSFLDCAYEELLQALGPINDDRSVPWTMFNDDVQMGFFDVYDQYILNILYDPHVRPGMTRRDLEGLLPNLLPEIRKRISAANSAEPLGASNDAGSGSNTSLRVNFRPLREIQCNRITYDDCRDRITATSDTKFPAPPK